MPVTEPISRNSLTSKHLNIGKKGGSTTASGGGSAGGAAGIGTNEILAHYGIETAQTLVIPNGAFPVNYPLNKLNFPQVLKSSTDVTLLPFRYQATTAKDVQISVYIECAVNANLDRHVLHVFRRNDVSVEVAHQTVAVVDGATLSLTINETIRLSVDDQIEIGVSVHNNSVTNQNFVINVGQVKIKAA
jgi:hypothetical protein